MSTCATCKHWTPFEGAGEGSDHAGATVKASRLGLCGKIVNGSGSSGRAPEGYIEGRADVDALVDDMSDAGMLRTSERFGCTLYEAKS